MSWPKQKSGTWRLQAHITPHGGEVDHFGDYIDYRTCVVVARAIARGRPDLNRWSATFLRSDKRDGATIDGFSKCISIAPPKYDPSLEFTLSDGRTVWLDDVNDILINAIRQEEAS